MILVDFQKALDSLDIGVLFEKMKLLFPNIYNQMVCVLFLTQKIFGLR